MSTPSEAIAEIQRLLGLPDKEQDGIWGPISQGALDRLVAKERAERLGLNEPHHVKASSFADPADVEAFRRCKRQGKSDQECFKVGDNGIGKWGDDTTGSQPMCALPPDDWQHLGTKARGAKVCVVANGRSVICELRDTMPWKRNIKNGAGIDLNPGACKILGLKPPVFVDAVWNWV